MQLVDLKDENNSRQVALHLPDGDYKIPKKVILTWKNLNIKIESKSLKQIMINSINKDTLQKRSDLKNYDTLLNDLHGIVEPGQMLALMGSRY